MEQIEKFKELCQQLEKSYHSQAKAKKGNQKLLKWSHEIRQELLKNYSLHKLDIFLSTLLNVAKARKSYQSYILDDCLSFIHIFLLSGLWSDDLPVPSLVLDEKLVEQEENARKKITHQTALKLLPFVIELFQIKLARDAYGNKRKAHVVKILDTIWDYYDTSIGIDLCQEALKSKNEELVVDTTNALLTYHLNLKKPLTEDLIALLNAQVKKTKHLYAARACLHLMQKTNYISEHDTEDQLYDWKERNDYPIF